MKCICGSLEFKTSQREGWGVTPEGQTIMKERLTLAECKKCGTIRQTDLPFFDEQGYITYYQEKYPPTTPAYEKKNLETDTRLADLRCQDYGIGKDTGTLLDVGAGSGAFVKEARGRGAEAYGCEIGEYHYADKNTAKFMYRGRLEDLNFPTDRFRMVTCHDVLEHVLDPPAFIAELFRITTQDGRCIIDFPDFYCEEGKHHWKKTEHIWFLRPEQLEKLLKQAGFQIEKRGKPIGSKIVFRLKKPYQGRHRILVPPGIGDSYWSIVKMQGFLKEHRLGLPDVGVVCPRSKVHDGHRRSFPFIQMFPFLNCNYESIEGRDPALRKIWREAYLRSSRTVFSDVAGYHHFISYNGNLRAGRSLEETDRYETNWYPPRFVSLEEEKYRQGAVKKYGKYLVFYFVFQGTYIYWTKQFPISQVIRTVTDICQQTGFTPVFTGASWDAQSDQLGYVIRSVPGSIDLTGKTTVEQLFGLIRGSQGVIGYPSGLTIAATMLKQKTMIIWNDYYNRNFHRNACPPDTWEGTYFAENTLGLTADYMTEWACGILEGARTEERHLQPQTKVGHIRRGVQPERLFTPKSILKRNVLETRPVDPSLRFVIACVLKSGGDYDETYVSRLQAMLQRNTTVPFEFICLTDMEEKLNGYKTIRLNHELKGWWAKVALFKKGIFEADRIIYFDLDTVILKNIDAIFSLEEDFYGLRPWNKANFLKGNLASGIMAWKNGKFDFLFNGCSSISEFRNDQEYLSEHLRSHNIRFKFLQESLGGIHSYKRECKTALPKKARIICFHGKPRLHTVTDPWVMDNWRE